MGRGFRERAERVERTERSRACVPGAELLGRSPDSSNAIRRASERSERAVQLGALGRLEIHDRGAEVHAPTLADRGFPLVRTLAGSRHLGDAIRAAVSERVHVLDKQIREELEAVLCRPTVSWTASLQPHRMRQVS